MLNEIKIIYKLKLNRFLQKNYLLDKIVTHYDIGRANNDVCKGRALLKPHSSTILLCMYL